MALEEFDPVENCADLSCGSFAWIFFVLQVELPLFRRRSEHLDTGLLHRVSVEAVARKFSIFICFSRPCNVTLQKVAC